MVAAPAVPVAKNIENISPLSTSLFDIYLSLVYRSIILLTGNVGDVYLGYRRFRRCGTDSEGNAINLYRLGNVVPLLLTVNSSKHALETYMNAVNVY